MFLRSNNSSFLLPGICATSALVTYAAVMQMQNKKSHTPYEFGIGFYLGWGMPICYFISAFCMTLDDMIHSVTNDCCLVCRKGGKHKSAAHVWCHHTTLSTEAHIWCHTLQRMCEVIRWLWWHVCDVIRCLQCMCRTMTMMTCSLNLELLLRSAADSRRSSCNGLVRSHSNSPCTLTARRNKTCLAVHKS
mgnify:CR=1 FL=1